MILARWREWSPRASEDAIAYVKPPMIHVFACRQNLADGSFPVEAYYRLL